jgi:acetyl-CoA synthase
VDPHRQGAVEKGFSFKHIGKVLHGKLHQEFGAILDKVQVKIYTEQDKVEEVRNLPARSTPNATSAWAP